MVRAAHAGETLVALDDQKERTLTIDMIVISDNGQTPLALAGVMGGKVQIDESTQDVLLESAAFSAGHISRTSRNLDLMSEASIRL